MNNDWVCFIESYLRYVFKEVDGWYSVVGNWIDELYFLILVSCIVFWLLVMVGGIIILMCIGVMIVGCSIGRCLIICSLVIDF